MQRPRVQVRAGDRRAAGDADRGGTPLSKGRVPATRAPRKRPPAPTSRRSGGWSPSRNQLLALAVAGAAAIAAVLIAISVLGGGDGETTATSTEPVSLDTSALASLRGIPQDGLVLGKPTAKSTIVEYGDLQCPACRQFAESSLPTVIDRFVRPGGRLEFRGLAFLGPDSTPALRFVLAAAEQDKAWDAIELFYANQGEENSGWVTNDFLRAMARALGLDPGRMVQAAGSSRFDDRIARMRQQAIDDGLSVTPTFVITTPTGTTKLDGAQPADALLAAVDKT